MRVNVEVLSSLSTTCDDECVSKYTFLPLVALSLSLASNQQAISATARETVRTARHTLPQCSPIRQSPRSTTLALCPEPAVSLRSHREEQDWQSLLHAAPDAPT